jgi:hypothetical protein
MSLKAIDLQMALHRNDEAAIQQNQLSHKPEADRTLLAEQTAKQAERAREQTTKPEHTAEMHIQGGDKHAAQQQSQSRKRRRQQPQPEAAAEAKTAPHPYKGHYIDVSL